MASQIQYIILDSELVDSQSELVPIYENRSGKYGDGFFETIHLFDSKPLYLHLHYQRLQIHH